MPMNFLLLRVPTILFGIISLTLLQASDGDASEAMPCGGAGVPIASVVDTSGDESLAHALAAVERGAVAGAVEVVVVAEAAVPVRAGLLGRDGDSVLTEAGSLLHRVVSPGHIDLLREDRAVMTSIHDASHVKGVAGRVMRNLLEDCQNVHTTNAVFLRVQVPRMLAVLMKYLPSESGSHGFAEIQECTLADTTAAAVRAELPAAFTQLRSYIARADREPETGFAMTSLTSIVFDVGQKLGASDASYAYLKSTPAPSRSARRSRAPTPVPRVARMTSMREIAETLLRRRLTLVERRRVARGEEILPEPLRARAAEMLAGSAAAAMPAPESVAVSASASAVMSVDTGVHMVSPLGLLAMSLTENKREGGGCYAGYAGRMGYLLLRFAFDYLGEGIGSYEADS